MKRELAEEVDVPVSMVTGFLALAGEAGDGNSQTQRFLRSEGG